MKKSTIAIIITAAIAVIALASCAATIGNTPKESAPILPAELPAPEPSRLEKLDRSFCELMESYYGDTVGSIELYLSPDDLDYGTLINRVENETLIIERSIGIVLNKEGDGRVLNIEGEYNYISYRHIGCDAPENTVIVTYCVYNPDTVYEDDIIARWDFPIYDRNTVIGGASYGY